MPERSKPKLDHTVHNFEKPFKSTPYAAATCSICGISFAEASFQGQKHCFGPKNRLFLRESGWKPRCSTDLLCTFTRPLAPSAHEVGAQKLSTLSARLKKTTQRPPGYVAHNISRDPGLVDCTVDLCDQIPPRLEIAKFSTRNGTLSPNHGVAEIGEGEQATARTTYARTTALAWNVGLSILIAKCTSTVVKSVSDRVLPNQRARPLLNVESSWHDQIQLCQDNLSPTHSEVLALRDSADYLL
eukprot:g56578.t1